MSLGNRIAKLEAKHAAEFSAWLLAARTEDIERFLDLTTSQECRGMLRDMSNAQLEQVARGDDSWLSNEQRATLETSP